MPSPATPQPPSEAFTERLLGAEPTTPNARRGTTPGQRSRRRAERGAGCSRRRLLGGLGRGALRRGGVVGAGRRPGLDLAAAIGLGHERAVDQVGALARLARRSGLNGGGEV